MVEVEEQQGCVTTAVVAMAMAMVMMVGGRQCGGYRRRRRLGVLFMWFEDMVYLVGRQFDPS